MFALVKMHVWDAGVEAKGVVAAAEGPEVNVVDFLDAFPLTANGKADRKALAERLKDKG